MVRTCCMWGLMVVTVAAIDPIQTALAGGGPECRARGIALLRERGPEGLAEAFVGRDRLKRERLLFRQCHCLRNISQRLPRTKVHRQKIMKHCSVAAVPQLIVERIEVASVLRLVSCQLEHGEAPRFDASRNNPVLV